VTVRFFGNDDRLVEKYGWYNENCHDHTWRAGELLPNGLGLFDVYGNVWEWCIDCYGKLPTSSYESPFVDAPKITPATNYVLRGGSITNRVSDLRSAERDFLDADHKRTHNVGFRIARTMPGD
jgi:formylglycine-generating enzyme required for sulfatase activity